MGTKLNHASLPEEIERQYWRIFEAISDGLIIHDSETLRVVDANPAAAAMHGYSRQEFIGLNPSSYIYPDSQDDFNESSRSVQSGRLIDTSAVHLRRDGTPFYVEVRRTAITYKSRPCLLSVVRDVSERVEAEQLLFQQEEERQREQSILLNISHALASSLEFKPDLILDQLGAIIKYTHAALFTLEDSTLIAVALRGVQPPGETAPLRIQLDGPGTIARLFNKHRPIRIADVSAEDKEARFLHSLLNGAAPLLLDGISSWMWVPLAIKGRVNGGIGVAHSSRDYFTSHHAYLALTVANQAAITLVNAELYNQAQALAAMQERQRIAQNLHDAVNQSLFSAGLIAEVLPRLWDRDQAMARESLEDLRRLTRGALAEMRSLLAELRPSTLTDADLADLLGLLLNSFTGRTNIPAVINVVGQGILPADVQVAIYRVCQEALNNVAKHARATKVKLDLKYDGKGIKLSIQDNGQGFDPEQTVSGHYGLTMMRERAEGVRARLSVTSRPGGGTELTIRWKEGEQK